MPTLAIHPGAVIFVTGVNGLIGSHIVDQLLKRGYNVRGAVRDVEKSKWLAKYFDAKYEGAKFEMVAVPDMTADGCYDEAVKGTAGFVHVASPLNGEDPNVVIPTAIKGGLNALKAAAKTPSIKRVVYTSSSIAATFPSPGVEKIITDESFNDEGTKKGWRHPEDEPMYLKGLYLYAALKTEAEKACWKWMQENKPHFDFNSILPNANFGKVLVPEKQGAPSTIAWAKSAFTGENFELIGKVITPQYFISTQDCAVLHIAALIYSDVASERLFGFAERFDFNKILAIYRKLYPDKKFPEDVPGLVDDGVKVPSERAEEVLRWVKDGEGWTRLEDAVGEMSAQFTTET
ncbi:dihydroflavonol-4-reductase [Trematosphaeria pertusa]|uniref:Dihydroflavonol-4-reductase n=1 Tax=Trematosphaeria pertusa TaxID=390896 RepID=A0A6A6I2P8_9PLEO|nr:dihydroflavonol-4-reductase [Trematosphaeria pertusa]KAF2244429.1 dihydroflavonol-4-reductase [Trematosphaeria pertusa]